MIMDKGEILKEMKSFLEGYSNDLNYLVHVEANPRDDDVDCIIHEPGGEKIIKKVKYTPFLYCKDLKKNGVDLYGDDEEYKEAQKIRYGIKIEKQKTGNQKRLEDGFLYKVTSYKSYSAILNYFKEGGAYPYANAYDEDGNILRDNRGNKIQPYRNLFFTLKPTEQFLIDKKARLFKGVEEYHDLHKVTFDIETTGLRPEISRVFAIGVRDTKGYETILEVDKTDDDDAEINLIRDFFNLISLLKPAVISGYNSEDFDFHYILTRAKILKMDMKKLPTSLKDGVELKRRGNASVKIGGATERYTSTEMWGISVIDIHHAAKKTMAINSDVKNTKLKYIAKFESVAKEDRTYIPGEDNSIGRYYHENPYFVANDKNEHIEVPSEYQEVSMELYEMKRLSKGDDVYESSKKLLLDKNPEFVKWFRSVAIEKGMNRFVGGIELVKQYLLDDLYETESIDNIYNQSSFLLAKIIPTTYSKVCTMGTASIWSLLLTAWSHHNGIAIPDSDVNEDFSGGLARCYKTGYSERIVKIDYASLYPMEQLTWGIFPIFDITGVIEKMLLYMTTIRNIYKKLANSDDLNNEEVELMKSIDHDTYNKYINNTLTKKERAQFKVKQLPLKILNNSLFGALGSDIAFNWSDNMCAAKITVSGRLDLRNAVIWFKNFGCEPLLAVTDGVNFKIPNKTTIKVTDDAVSDAANEAVIEEMWKYHGLTGIGALIEKFNVETAERLESGKINGSEYVKKSYISVDNDGEFISCLNLSRINYALLYEAKDKKSGEMVRKVKLTGNTIKSKVMPEYVEEFIDKGLRMILEGEGSKFVDYYNNYVDDIYYKQIPLKKIANKSRFKMTLAQYAKRGTDKNGRAKAMQAHMELVIQDRNDKAVELFEIHKDKLEFKKSEDKLTVKQKLNLVSLYMPPEPELDSTIYYVNTGYRKSHGDSKTIKDVKTGEMRFASTLISNEDLNGNVEIFGDYNVDKYLDAFNKRVKSILVGFEPEIREKILAKISRKKVPDITGKKKKEVVELLKGDFTKNELTLKSFDKDDVEESMYLEEREVEFWNKYGYDPRLVWDGFKVHDDMKVYYEIYDDALKFLNDKLEVVNKPKIKSRSEMTKKGDLILLKEGNRYDVGFNNGKFIEIVRTDVEIPKSDIEIELERILHEKKEAIRKMAIFNEEYNYVLENLNDKMEEVGKNPIKSFNDSDMENGDLILVREGETYNIGLYNDEDIEIVKKNIDIPSQKNDIGELTEKRMKYFDNFCLKFKLPKDVDYFSFMLDSGKEGVDLLDEFIDIEENKIEDDAIQYMCD